MKFNLRSFMLMSTAMLVSAPVLAQGGPSAAGAASEDNVIIVTARNREENIQSVPIAVTAIDSKDILRRGMDDLNDVARFTPGFSFENLAGGNAAPTIRGMSTVNVTSREQTTASFYDGVYMPRSWLVDSGAFNLQRIEIVKGPQSARYGRNAFSGAINYIPNRASLDRTRGEGRVNVGIYDRFDAGGFVNLVAVDDMVAIGGGFFHSQFDGTWRNTHPFANSGLATDGRVGGWNSQSYSASIALKPVAGLTLEASYYGFDRDEEAPPNQYFNTSLGQGNCGSLQAGGRRLFCGEFPVGDTVSVEPRSFNRRSNVDIIRAAAKVELGDSLNAEYVFGYVKANTLTANSAEADQVNCGTVLSPALFAAGSPNLCNFQASPLGEVDYKSHDFRLSWDNGGPIRAAIGGFILNGEDRNFFVSVNVPRLNAGSLVPLNITSVTSGPTGAPPFNPARFANLVVRDEVTDTDVAAIFGEVTFSVSETTRLSAELRYTWEDIRTRSTAGFDRKAEFGFFTPRFTIEHDASDNVLLYASAARGAKAGGFNAQAIVPAGATVSPFGTFDPEFNWTFELGAKSTVLEGRGTINVAAFYTDWSNQQITSSDPNGNVLTTAIIRNLGNVRVWGLELESALQVTDAVSFNIGASYTDAQFKNGTQDVVFASFSAPFTAAPCDNIVCNANGQIGGNVLPRAPKFQGAFGVQYEGKIGEKLGYFARLDGAYQANSFADTINASQVGDRFVANGRIGFDFDRFGLAIWARNLFDAKYVSNSTQIIQRNSANLLSRNYGERRTLGVTLSANF